MRDFTRFYNPTAHMRQKSENVRKSSMPLALGWGAFGLLVFFAAPGLAQEFRAGISGEVTDPSGAAVTMAKVVAQSVERNVTYEADTNAAGRYAIQFLPPGTYSISVEKPGFRRFVRERVTLLAEDKPAIDVKLDVGALVDTVTVSGATPLLQTENANRQAVIENRILQNVPSGGRNLYALQY